MFDFLDKTTAETAFPAGHFAIQFIRQWAAGAVRSGRTPSLEGLPPTQLDLAKRIVAEIELREGKPAWEIPEQKVEFYINSIWGRLQQVSRVELHADPDKGKSLLDKLRLAY